MRADRGAHEARMGGRVRRRFGRSGRARRDPLPGKNGARLQAGSGPHLQAAGRPPVSFGQYVLGLVLLGITVGASVLTARVVVSHRLAGLPGYARGAAYGVLVAAAVLVATLVPAALGLLGR